jgi:hypothetical protein
VSCGYFRAARRFFSPVDFHQRDVAYVASQLDVGDVTVEAYPDRTRQRHQKFILEFYGFLPFDINTEATLTLEIAAMARTHLKPRLIFDRYVDFLIQKRIQVPRVRTLSDLIRSGLHERKAELIAMMDSNLTDETRFLLDDLFSSPDDQKRYRLTLLKKMSQSTKPSRIKECIADYKVLFTLYKQLNSIFSVLLGLSRRKNKLYFAFRELGRVARTAFLLEYITDKNLRRIIQGSTNKCESFNNFAGWVYFADSMIRENVRDEQVKIVKYNHLVTNLILFHNV